MNNGRSFNCSIEPISPEATVGTAMIFVHICYIATYHKQYERVTRWFILIIDIRGNVIKSLFVSIHYLDLSPISNLKAKSIPINNKTAVQRNGAFL